MINIENYLRLSLVDAGMVLLSTLLIVVIAKKYFWNILLEYLNKRESYIKQQLLGAEEKNKAGEGFYNKAKEELRKVKAEADETLTIAEERAKKVAEEILKEARREATLIIETARREIERERLESEAKMKDEMAVIAMAAAKEIVKKEIDDRVHKRFIKEFIHEVGEKSWGA